MKNPLHVSKKTVDVFQPHLHRKAENKATWIIAVSTGLEHFSVDGYDLSKFEEHTCRLVIGTKEKNP
jgi:hypothetical protein